MQEMKVNSEICPICKQEATEEFVYVPVWEEFEEERTSVKAHTQCVIENLYYSKVFDKIMLL